MTTRVALRAYRRKIKESEVPQRFAWCNNATLPAQGGRARCNNATLPVKELRSKRIVFGHPVSLSLNQRWSLKLLGQDVGADFFL